MWRWLTSDLKQALDRRLAELRESFDLSFAVPQEGRTESRETFLIIGAGGERYAIGTNAVLGVEHHRRIVALPLQVPGLLGLAGVRGQLMPVFSLASLLGGSAVADASTWLVLCKDETAIGFAFDRFEASVQVWSQEIHAAELAEGACHLARQAVRLDSHIVYVIDIPSAVAAARQRLGQG